MHKRRPELQILTITILLGTLALALAIVVGYAWWTNQRGLTRHTREKVDLIAQFLENGMALLPQGGADLEGLYILMQRVGEENGARSLNVSRGEAVTRQYGPATSSYLPDEQAQQVLHNGRDVTIVETQDGRRFARRLKAMAASPTCLACHEAQPGEILGVLDVSFDLARVQPAGPDFYRNLLLVSTLVSVITVLLVFLVFSRINMARRIESVTSLAGGIAAGDLDHRLTALPGTDMDGLAGVINDMAESLQVQQATLARQQQELEEANQRLEVLVQESHHRIKNNLQTVADLLALQATDCPAGGGSCLQDSIQRVKSIAAVHELLSAEQTESTNIHALARRLLDSAVRNVARPNQQIVATVDDDGIYLASKQATALALVLGELFNNALIHGMAGRTKGEIAVSIGTRAGQATLTVQDDGAGLPPGFRKESHQQLGLRIVQTLVQHDLGGEFSLQSDGAGTAAWISFPYPAGGQPRRPSADASIPASEQEQK